MSRENVTASMEKYKDEASRLSLLSLGGLALGSLMTGLAANAGLQGDSVLAGFEIFAAAAGYSMGACCLAKANHNSQQAAALRGALAQDELAASD